MATITREDIDALNVRLTVSVTKEDYASDLQKELKRYRNQAQLKGFRKGKTPMSVVRKMFGRSILNEVVNKQMQEEMSEYLFNDDNKLDFLGQPIPVDDQELYDFSTANLEDYEFKFDLGLAPQFELQGLEDGHAFEQLVVTPEDSVLTDELDNLRRRKGSSVEVELPTEERDIITVEGVEFKGKKAKKDGLTCEFTLFIENTTDAVKKAFLGKELGEKAVLDIYDLEENNTEDHVRKYLLKLEEGDEREVESTFQLTLTKISRNEPAELNEEFFTELFPGGEVTDEAGALAKIKEDYQKYYVKQSEALLFRDMQEYLMGQNVVTFPEAFLKRWLVFSNENNTKESVEAGFENFTKGLQWTLVREKLIKIFEVKVTEEEMRASFTEQVYGYFGGGQPEWLNEEMITGMVDRMMKEEKGVREKADELMNNKLSDLLRGKVVLSEKPVSPEEFQEIIAAAQAKAEAESALLGEEEE